MSTFLPPIERPASLLMKLMYFFSKKQFGKVMTGLKVTSARMPIAFSLFYFKVSQLDKKLVLPAETVLLLRQLVAQINICEFCIDMSRYAAIKASISEQKFDALNDYTASPLFTQKEKTAFDYASELTRNKKVAQETFDELKKHFTGREICEIVHIVATEHLYNISNIGMNIHSDMICDIARKKQVR